MLFDLQSPRRRRVLKIVYGTLAALFLIGFVGFGVGTNTGGGGILDSITGGGGGGDDNPFEDDINAAEDKLAQNPKDTTALSQLVELHYQAGTGKIEVDEETGQQSVPSDAEDELNEAADAWAKYEKASGGKLAPGTASLAVQTFTILGDAALSRALEDESQADALSDVTKATSAYDDAGEAQRVVVESRPSANGYAQLAFLFYRAANLSEGDAATQQAVQLSKGTEATQVKKTLDQYRQQGQQIDEAVAQLQKNQTASAGGAPGGATGENPLSGLSGGGTSGGGFGAGGLGG